MNTLKELLADFEVTVRKSMDLTWESKNLPINLEIMAKEAAIISQKLVAIGDYAYEKLGAIPIELTEKQQYEYGWVTYEWANLAKSFLLLWRDILFEQQKGQLIRFDGLATAASLRALNLASQETLDKALEDFKGDTERGLNSTSKIQLKKNKAWQLQLNPWNSYKKQLLEIVAQCQELQKDYRVLLHTVQNFNEIEALVFQTEQFCTEEVQKAQTLAQEIIEQNEEDNTPKLGQIIKYLEELEIGISLPNHFNAFTTALEHRINALSEREEVPIDTNGGIVEIKDLTFKRSTKQWLDAEILPILYEIWELTENAHNSLKMALINIKNRAILLDAEEKEGRKIDLDKTTLFQPLDVFLKNADATTVDLQKLNKTIYSRLKTVFNVSAIYDSNTAFLPVPLQEATLNQLRESQNRVQNRIGNWVQQQWKQLQNLRASVAREDALSDSEKIVRLIQSRTAEQHNSNYASIFLTKGYIGESFAIGRQQELEHAKTLIENWKQGFRGAVVITGERFSGKTILGELIASRFFQNNTIRLTPDALIKLNGRRMTTTFDLEPALSFVKKYGNNKNRPLIWIDDLELWWDKDLPLSQNVRTLSKFIDANAHHFFFLVSMSNWLNSHLNLFHETSKVFQAEINVDKMSLEDIREAIMIRHGATHKKLLNAEGEAISAHEFNQLIKKIYRQSNGNIGEALNRWSCSTKRVDINHVRHEKGDNYGLPDFLNPDVAILLSAIMMEKRTNEYRLRKLFGPAFTEKYSPILQRLISVGLLKRQLDGWFEINDVLVNDLGHLLEDKGYLRYHREVLM